MSWLLASVSPIVHGQILNAKDVATAWKILHTRYAGSNVSRKFALKRDLGNMKQGDLDLAHYYAKLAKFWEELEAISRVSYMNGVIGDKCGKCTEMEAERDEDKVIQFLMGLNESHAQVRTNILALRVIPDMDVVYDMVAEDESQQSVTKAPYEEVSAMYVQNPENNATQMSRQMQGTVYNSGNRQSQGGRGPPRPRLYCTHCHMGGHTKEFYYKLVGFPPNSKFQRGPTQGNKPNNGYKGPMSNAVSASSNQSHVNANPDKGNSNAVKDVSVPQLSQDQWDKLLSLINPSAREKESADNKIYMAGPNIQNYPADW